MGSRRTERTFESARANLAGYGRRVRLQNKAVCRSDRPGKQLYFTDCPEPSNMGWREVFGDAGVAVPAVAFDDVIIDITDGGRRRVHLLKAGRRVRQHGQ